MSNNFDASKWYLLNEIWQISYAGECKYLFAFLIYRHHKKVYLRHEKSFHIDETSNLSLTNCKNSSQE